jgi:hypothetical protein
MVGMWRVLASIGCVLAGTAFAEAPPRARGEPVLAEAVVAVVRGPGAPAPRVVTLTRLEEEARIALVARGATGAAVAPLDQAALRAALDWVVDQTLLGDEAARLQIFEVEQADLDAEVRRFRERFARPAGYRAFLDRLELSEDELGAVLRRTLRVQRYVESRAGGGDAVAVERKVRSMVEDLRRRSEVRIIDQLLLEVQR